MTRIKSIRGRQIIDCKRRPMVEADVILEDGSMGRASAPTGTSVGSHEAYVLRDGDPGEYRGLGVRKAVANVNGVIASMLTGMHIHDQQAIDRRMIEEDGTDDKHILGGNAIYAVSSACLRAYAAHRRKPVYQCLSDEKITSVPVPGFNMINGGKFDGFTQSFNEFIVIPYDADTIDEVVETAVLVFDELGRVLEKYLGHKPTVASSFGFAAISGDPEEILDLLLEAVKISGFENKAVLGLDCASSGMYDAVSDTYLLKGCRVCANDLIAYAKYLSEKYPLLFIEDLLDENAWEAFPIAVSELNRTWIIGDDLIACSRPRLERAWRSHACDGFILKPNQIGTITEAIETWKFACDKNLLTISSGRSGGAVDDIVMELAVGLGLKFIKTGAPQSGERIDKLNFLLRASDLTPGCLLPDLKTIARFK